MIATTKINDIVIEHELVWHKQTGLVFAKLGKEYFPCLENHSIAFYGKRTGDVVIDDWDNKWVVLDTDGINYIVQCIEEDNSVYVGDNTFEEYGVIFYEGEVVEGTGFRDGETYIICFGKEYLTHEYFCHQEMKYKEMTIPSIGFYLKEYLGNHKCRTMYNDKNEPWFTKCKDAKKIAEVQHVFLGNMRRRR